MTDKPTTPDRRTMHPDVAHLLQAVQSRDDAITGLRADVQAMPDHIGRAMQDAIMRSVSDPLLWAAAGQALRRHARDQAGGWLFGGLKAIGTRIGWALIVVGGVYLMGGWSALAAQSLNSRRRSEPASSCPRRSTWSQRHEQNLRRQHRQREHRLDEPWSADDRGARGGRVGILARESGGCWLDAGSTLAV